MPKTTVALLALACVLVLPACSQTDAEAPASTQHSTSGKLPEGNIDAGRELATKGATGIASCTSCHGAEGNAPIDGMYPKIGGQYGDYLARSLQEYRNGGRAGATADVMAGQAKQLSDQQIANLAAYYASVGSSLVDLQNVK